MNSKAAHMSQLDNMDEMDKFVNNINYLRNVT